jgi:hypothetical protein
MEIAVAEQGAFCVPPTISPDEARGYAAHYRTSAFGGLTQLFSRPKPDDIAVTASGLRYVPYWHAAAHLRVVYDRYETYRFPVATPENVISLSIGESKFDIESDRKERSISVAGVAHCVRDVRKELWIDATTGDPLPARSVGTAAPIDLTNFEPESAAIIDPTVRASAVIRQIMGDDVKPPEADAYHEERAEIELLDLYFLPFYAYELVWAAKNKNASITVDGCSGEIVQNKSAMHPAIAKLLNKETLFDIGSETLNLVVPGGAIPLKLVRALRQKRSEAGS